MITPFFKLEQDEQFIFITIKAKYVKISEVEFFIEKNNFRFSLKPYFLNLNFSHNIKDSEKNSSKYDVENGILICKIEKENSGDFFENLDLLSNLMMNSNTKDFINKNINKIEEIQGELNPLDIQKENFPKASLTSNEIEEEILKLKYDFQKKTFSFEDLNEIYFEFLYFIKDQKNFKPEMIFINNSEFYSYGFNNQYSDVFFHRQEEMLEISDLNPEKIQIKNRFFEKMKIENNDFIPERYVGDFFLNEENPDIFKADLKIFLKKQIKSNLLESLFTEKEQNLLLSLNKIKLNLLEDDNCFEKSELENLKEIEKKYLITKSLKFEFYLQIIDLLFAYLYDFRINDFEQNSESGWNINKLSSMLSCHLNYNNVFFSFNEEPPFDLIVELIKNTLICSYRRILCYPLYRSFDLCEKIKNSDIPFILNNGKSYILKSLLNIRIAFERSEPRFILNQIYIDQLIRWVQTSNESVWKIIGEKIDSIEIQITKIDLKLNLIEIEEDYI